MTRKASDAAIEREVEFYNGLGYGVAISSYSHSILFTAHCDERQSLSDALRDHFGADVPASLAGYVLPVVVFVAIVYGVNYR